MPPTINHKGISKRWWIAIAVIAGGAWWWFSGSKDQEASAPPPVAIRVAPVERRDVPRDLNTVGTVIPYETVALRSRLDSQIMEVRFKDGDRVEQGQILFVLDDRTLKAQLGEMEANVARDKAQLENLRRQYDRTRDLTRQGFASKSELDDAKAAYEAQKATAGASQASLENARVQLGYTTITAPISGRTGTINVTVGNTVKANDTQPLVTINQIRPIRVQAALPQEIFEPIRTALSNGAVPAVATRDGSDIKTTGVVEYIDNQVDQSTGTFVIRARFDNEDESLWPGMFVTLTLSLGDEAKALTIPVIAVQHSQAGDAVFVIQDGKAQKRMVEITRTHDQTAVIAKGVNEGETVATDGLMSLKDGSAVTVSTPGKDPAP